MSITSKIQYGYGKTAEAFSKSHFVDTIKMANKQSKIAKTEVDDCVVRAFMAALDLSYEDAHSWVKTKLKRKDKKGTYVEYYAKNIIGKTKNGKQINWFGSHPSELTRNKLSYGLPGTTLINKKYKNPTGYTLKSFIESHPTGSFVVLVVGHAVAVVNGVVYGNSDDQYDGIYRSVHCAFECK